MCSLDYFDIVVAVIDVVVSIATAIVILVSYKSYKNGVSYPCSSSSVSSAMMPPSAS